MNLLVNNLTVRSPRRPPGAGAAAVAGHKHHPPDLARRKAWSHERSHNGKEEWLTPPSILGALGSFDLDPCAAVRQPWATARRHFTILDDGLIQLWHGRVWLNPPYGTQTGRWLDRLAQHGNGIALVFARTETRMFFSHVWGRADAVLFLRSRLTFWNADGTPAAHSGGAPSCLVAYGKENAQTLRECGLPGCLVHTWKLKNGGTL